MSGPDVRPGVTGTAAQPACGATDEVLVAVFTAGSPSVVAQTRDRAGPAQQVTTATEVDLLRTQ